MDEDALQRIEDLRQSHERRLHELKLKKARLGINTPSEIVIEIEDIENEIEQLALPSTEEKQDISRLPAIAPDASSRTSRFTLRTFLITVGVIITFLIIAIVFILWISHTPQPTNPVSTSTVQQVSLTPQPINPVSTSTPQPQAIKPCSPDSSPLNFLCEPGFEGKSWTSATPPALSTRTSTEVFSKTGWWQNYHNGPVDSYFAPETEKANVYAGDISCRIKGPGQGLHAYVAQTIPTSQPVPSNTQMGLSFYYKTKGEVSLKVTIQFSNTDPMSWTIPPTNEFTKYETNSFPTPPSLKFINPTQVYFDVTGIGEVWIDEVSLHVASVPRPNRAVQRIR